MKIHKMVYGWNVHLAGALDLPPNDLEGSDDSLRLQPGVGDWLIRQELLVSPLVQVKWVPSRTGSAISAQPCMAGGRVIVSCG
jgi:hypothetical protein